MGTIAANMANPAMWSDWNGQFGSDPAGIEFGELRGAIACPDEL